MARVVVHDDIPLLIKCGDVFNHDPASRKIYSGTTGEFLKIHRNNRKMYDRLNRDL